MVAGQNQPQAPNDTTLMKLSKVGESFDGSNLKGVDLLSQSHYSVLDKDQARHLNNESIEVSIRIFKRF